MGHRQTVQTQIRRHRTQCLIKVSTICLQYNKTCEKRPLSKRPKIGFQDQLSLNAGQKYCRVLKKFCRILQYFRPSLSYHLSLRSLHCLFLSSRFTQVLLYVPLKIEKKKINTTQQPLQRKLIGPIDKSRKFHSA